jgi:hypothetical protein
MVFCTLRREISPLCVCLKNTCDGVGGQDESNGTHLASPLFWLDNIFNTFPLPCLPCLPSLPGNIQGIKATGTLFLCNILDVQLAILPGNIVIICQEFMLEIRKTEDEFAIRHGKKPFA